MTQRQPVRDIVSKQFPWFSLLLMLIVVAWSILIPVTLYFTGGEADTIHRLALGVTLQVGFVMLMGFVCLFFGVMMTWLGIEAVYDFQGEGEGGGAAGRFALTSASPGLFFALLGTLLCVFSLYKPLGFVDSSNDGASKGRPVVDSGQRYEFYQIREPDADLDIPVWILKWHFRPDIAKDVGDFHYVVCRGDQPTNFYYYNPRKRIFWGRMLMNGNEPRYEYLRKPVNSIGELDDLAETDFETKGGLPGIPGADDKDDRRMALPDWRPPPPLFTPLEDGLPQPPPAA